MDNKPHGEYQGNEHENSSENLHMVLTGEHANELLRGLNFLRNDQTLISEPNKTLPDATQLIKIKEKFKKLVLDQSDPSVIVGIELSSDDFKDIFTEDTPLIDREVYLDFITREASQNGLESVTYLLAPMLKLDQIPVEKINSFKKKVQEFPRNYEKLTEQTAVLGQIISLIKEQKLSDKRLNQIQNAFMALKEQLKNVNAFLTPETVASVVAKADELGISHQGWEQLPTSSENE